MECKETSKNAYNLTAATWAKVNEEAFESGKAPIMALNINGLKLYVIGNELFQQIVGAQVVWEGQ